MCLKRSVSRIRLYSPADIFWRFRAQGLCKALRCLMARSSMRVSFSLVCMSILSSIEASRSKYSSDRAGNSIPLYLYNVYFLPFCDIVENFFSTKRLRCLFLDGYICLFCWCCFFLLCSLASCRVEGGLHCADFVAVFGCGKEVHLLGGHLHFALRLAYVLAQLYLAARFDWFGIAGFVF